MQKGYLPARESTLPPEVAASVSAPVDLARSHVVDGALVRDGKVPFLGARPSEDDEDIVVEWVSDAGDEVLEHPWDRMEPPEVDPSWCPLHSDQMVMRDGKSGPVYCHKVPEGWCNGERVAKG
jgi:hypothetical protein